MVSLKCPLCCNETFSSPASLKNHLLKIWENLVCPFCQAKFNNLPEFTNHLESNCVEEFPENKENLQVLEVNETYKDSLLAQALLASPRRDVTEKLEIQESQYYCQMCSVHFEDIEQHLSSFHEGEEILLEEDAEVEGESGAEVNENETENDTIFIIDPATQEDENEENGETDVLNTSPTKKLNTISQQDFKDRDGRLYTRKFVKIDKFWLQNDSLKGPVLQKFISKDDGTKITSEEIGQVITINKCTNCNLCFSNDELFKNHKCAETKELKCTHCSLEFNDPDSFREHSKTHATKENSTKQNPVGPYNCEICNTTFPTFKSLRLHRRMHDPIKSREIEAPSKYGLFENDINEQSVRHMFICKICNKTYDKQYEFIHMNSHNENNGFICEVCNRKFFSQANLDMHMKAHSNNKKFTCSYCKKPFVTYDALNEHLLNQCQRRPYACQFCGRRFARPHEKVKHERIHTGEKPHVCDICGKAFRVSYCLTLHLRTHSGTRPYQCKDCGKRFKSHSVYNHHLLTHSDVRAYKCPYCPKAFKTSVQLAGHKNSHIKPFTCTECNRPFASLYAVRAHMETHKRDNNLKYECWMCGALYSRAFALKDHLKQQHQVEGDKAKAVALSVEEEMEATNSILVNEDDIILGLDGATNIEIIEHENE